MLVVLAPSKSQNFDAASLPVPATAPSFAADAGELASHLAGLAPCEIAQLMRVSEQVAAETHERYRAWRAAAPDVGRAALFAYTGETYRGLSARELSREDLVWAQDHLRILSALYGVLRPFDRIRPYRLDFTVPLNLATSRSLYDYWDDRPTRNLATALARTASPDLICLASAEFARLIRRDRLPGRLVTPVFKERTPRGLRAVSVYAKQARGTMARWIIRERIERPHDLPRFSLEGYSHDSERSTPEAPLFVR